MIRLNSDQVAAISKSTIGLLHNAASNLLNEKQITVTKHTIAKGSGDIIVSALISLSLSALSLVLNSKKQNTTETRNQDAVYSHLEKLALEVSLKVWRNINWEPNTKI
jgi:hypothetical protein